MIPIALKLHTYLTDLVHHDDRGATAVEYGLLIGLISIAIVAVLGYFGAAMVDMFAAWVEAVSGAADDASVPPLS